MSKSMYSGLKVQASGEGSERHAWQVGSARQLLNSGQQFALKQASRSLSPLVAQEPHTPEPPPELPSAATEPSATGVPASYKGWDPASCGDRAASGGPSCG